MRSSILLTVALTLTACGGPSPAQDRVRIDAAKDFVGETLGTYRPAPSKAKPLKSLAIKKTLPRKIADISLRSDVGVALDIGEAKAIVVEGLYGLSTPNVRVLVLDIATEENLADHVEGEAFAKGELVEHSESHLTYVANGRFMIDIAGEEIGPDELRAGLEAIDIAKLYTLSGAK